MLRAIDSADVAGLASSVPSLKGARIEAKERGLEEGQPKHCRGRFDPGAPCRSETSKA